LTTFTFYDVEHRQIAFGLAQQCRNEFCSFAMWRSPKAVNAAEAYKSLFGDLIRKTKVSKGHGCSLVTIELKQDAKLKTHIILFQ
jgi:hypothetical protein